MSGKPTDISVDSINNIKYEVYLPLLDGADRGIQHTAVYCAHPHETTYFNENDVVYVAVVDLDSSDLVILGMADRDDLQSVQGRISTGYNFQSETQSMFGVNNVGCLTFAGASSVCQLPNNLSVIVSNADKVQTVVSETKKPPLNKALRDLQNEHEEAIKLNTLCGMPEDQNLGTIIWPQAQGGLGVNLETATEAQKDKLRKQLGVMQTIAISETQFDALVQGTGLKENAMYFIYNDD